jgi:hypothetical protein
MRPATRCSIFNRFLSSTRGTNTAMGMGERCSVPYSTEWFSVPPTAPHGQTPKLGVLHPSLVRAVQATFQAASR